MSIASLRARVRREMRGYFDANATLPLSKSALMAMTGAAEMRLGNPSSVHAEGRAARGVLEKARRQVADAFARPASEVVFTSGGTESVYLGIAGLARKAADLGRPKTIAILATEHPCMFDAATMLAHEGFQVERVPTDAQGMADPERWVAAASRSSVVGVSLANHETGVIQDVKNLSSLAREQGALVFCDAVQALGKMSFNLSALGVDAASFSSHKVGGPAGSGCLWITGGDAIGVVSIGAQERGRRAGTEGVLGAAGFGAACQDLALQTESVEQTLALRVQIENALAEMGFCDPRGPRSGRLCNTINVGYAGISAELWVSALDLKGFSISAGAACSSGTQAPSPVLLAMGASEAEARESIRISLPCDANPQSVEGLLEAIREILPRLIAFAA